MTSEQHGRNRRLEDQLYVDALLAEAGFVADDDELRDALLRLRSFRTTEVPVPCAELAALIQGSGAGGAGPAGTDGPLAEVVPLPGRARKQPRRKRAVLTSLAVAASLGIAGGAAAGNETVRRQAAGTIDTIVRSFAPPAPVPVPAGADQVTTDQSGADRSGMNQSGPGRSGTGPTPGPEQRAEAPGPESGVRTSAAEPSGAEPGHPGTAPRIKDPAEAPGHAGAGAAKATPAEPEPAAARPVPPSSSVQERDRRPAYGTAPGAQDGPGAPPAEAVPAATEEPQPRVSRGISPR
ncbi:hypothetical protein ACIQC0_02640 [Pseudarthrobacter sp. NPDC092419]|uniref:hypothetical protein n=1 Tax=Pseudarthrobacter sp. NPDC092419 TaxID=3364414 RepID=UPI00381CFE2C